VKVVIAPHIDDAFLSLGGSILNWLKHEKVRIIYLFSVSSFTHDENIHKKTYPSDVAFVTSLRKEEELSVQKLTGTEVIFLDMACRSARDHDLDMGYVKDVLLKVISKDDTLFFPLSIGKHVDHILVYELGKSLLKGGYNIFFYEDLPYMTKKRDISLYTSDILLSPVIKDIDIKTKLKLLRLYESQMTYGWLYNVESYAYFLGDEKRYCERYWCPKISL